MKSIWNVESIPPEAAKYASRSAFSAGNQSAYKAAHRLNLLHVLYPAPTKPEPVKPLKGWSLEQIGIEGLKYGTKSEFKLGAHAQFAEAGRMGLMPFLEYLWARERAAKRMPSKPATNQTPAPVHPAEALKKLTTAERMNACMVTAATYPSEEAFRLADPEAHGNYVFITRTTGQRDPIWETK